MMNFGQALDILKSGGKLSRGGWNGKNMFVVYQKGYPEGIKCNEQTALAWGLNEGDLFKCEPYLQIRMANGSHAMWVPSINDILAEDWVIGGIKEDTSTELKEVKLSKLLGTVDIADFNEGISNNSSITINISKPMDKNMIDMEALVKQLEDATRKSNRLSGQL